MEFPLTTSRLLIRPFDDDDLNAMHEIYADPEVMQFIPSGTSRDLAHSRQRLEKIKEHQDKNGFSQWAVVEQATGNLVGICGLILVESKGPEVEVAYEFARAVWNRGYATEAIGACLRAGFEQFGMTRIVGMTFPDNVPSQRVLEKNGMRRLGIRQYYNKDLVLYELTVVE